MFANNNKTSLLETILGSEIIIPTSNYDQREGEKALQIISNDLYYSLANYFDSSTPFFQTSLPLEKIVRYKDGSFSSMEKSLKGGFSQHQGYEIIKGMDIAQQLMSHVMPRLNQRLASIYSDLVNQNNDYLNQIQDIFIIPEISKLKAIAEFIKDVSDEIEEISKSNNLSIATLTNIQQRRIDLRQTFHTFLSRLQQSVNSTSFDPQNIANSYLITRYALSNYIVSLVLECIISGNLDDVSVERMKKKIEKHFYELKNITVRISQILEQRKYANANEIGNIDSLYHWSYDYLMQNRLNNLHVQNSVINNLQNYTLQYFDIGYEMQRLDDFIKSRHDILKKIEILKND